MQDRESAELTHIELESAKFKEELLVLRNQRSVLYLLVQMTPVVSVLLALVGLVWAVFQYIDQQDKNRTTAEREFMTPWLQSQRQIYLEALSAAARVANAEDAEDRKQAEAEFWQLYQGKMITVETESVSGAMVDFGKCLTSEPKCNSKELNNLTRILATKMAKSMADTAGMNYQTFASNQFKYSAEK